MDSFDFLTLHVQMMILSLLRLFWLMSFLVWTSVGLRTSAKFHLESRKKPHIFVHCVRVGYISYFTSFHFGHSIIFSQMLCMFLI